MAEPRLGKQTIYRKPLLSAMLEQTKKVGKVEIKEIVFQPGQKTGLHFHPCPVVGYIAEGTAVFHVEGSEEKTLRAGDAFFEPPNAKILRFDNASDKKGMKFIAFYLLDAGEEELIRMLE
ncbi:MAG: cupin domain-containing protein [Acidobacteria bacterium]|nr:cupin domain-containing protein [Acidobacteriota bacterium]